MAANITINSPCPEPDSVEASGPKVVQLAPYNYTGATNRIEFTPESFVVEPSICTVHYSCEVAGDQRVIDLCSIGLEETTSSFDSTTGTFTLESVNMDDVPPGLYTIRITGTVGSKSDSIELTVELVNPCPTADLVLSDGPIPSFDYVLRSNPISKQWNITDIIDSTNVLVDCGPISVDFFNDD